MVVQTNHIKSPTLLKNKTERFILMDRRTFFFKLRETNDEEAISAVIIQRIIGDFIRLYVPGDFRSTIDEQLARSELESFDGNRNFIGVQKKFVDFHLNSRRFCCRSLLLRLLRTLDKRKSQNSYQLLEH